MTLESRIAAGRPVGEATWRAAQLAAARLGVALIAAAWEAARFELKRDPYSGEHTLIARWRDETHCNTVSIDPQGRVYAEFDLLVAHPQKPGWWVEAIEIWGQPSQLKTDLRLLPAPGA
jgi:hypothetical protein